VRTGLSAVAVGFAAAQLLTNLEPQALVLAASVTLVLVGILAIGFGFWSFRETLAELDRGGVRGIPLGLIALLSLLLVLASLGVLVLMVIN
jgi:uncharacterized membrane protein YidH (DUF202 family)